MGTSAVPSTWHLLRLLFVFIQHVSCHLCDHLLSNVCDSVGDTVVHGWGVRVLWVARDRNVSHLDFLWQRPHTA